MITSTAVGLNSSQLWDGIMVNGAPALPAAAIASASDAKVVNTASRVTIQSGPAPASPVYSLPVETVAWASPPADAISETMLANIRTGSGADNAATLLRGLGASLLNRFATSQTDYDQAVSDYFSLGASETNHAQAVLKAQTAENKIGLTLKTASGKQVEVQIAFDQNNQDVHKSLAVQIRTSSPLTQEESAAVAGLAQGFETALQGIAQNSSTGQTTTPPSIDLSGLLNADFRVLASVDLKVNEASRFAGLQSFAFHADAASRSVSLNSANGTVSVNVTKPASGGVPVASKEQQKAAIERYLKQFDAANARAQGQPALLSQFKDMFSQLQSVSPASTAQIPSLPAAFKAASKQWLSGLDDFQASMSGEFSETVGNELRMTGKLDYQVAQKTSVISDGNRLSASQTETSSLNATILRSRGGALHTETGNYDIYRVHDSSNVTTAFSTVTRPDGSSYVEAATRTRLIQQLMQYEKLVNHKVVETRDTPDNIADKVNLLTQKTSDSSGLSVKESASPTGK